MRLTRGRAKQKLVIKKIEIPEIITEDLGYYMQFGFKRIATPDNGRYHELKHSKIKYSKVDFYE
jgi:hypothetical protein